jgi:phage baseplate assembly protein W
MDKSLSIEASFIGAGWAFRRESGVGIDSNGNIALVSGDSDIAKSIYIILSTAPGERVMRTEFGCGIHDLVFGSPGPQLFGMVSYYVKQALGRWEPRIEVLEVTCAVDPVQHEKLVVNINYMVRQTNNERNLVYPFYVIPRGQD